MTPTARLYEKEYAHELLKIARGDLGSARDLSKGTEGRPENVCYIAEQCIEKCLKAVVCFLGKPVPHTHDLEAIVQLIPPQNSPPDAEQLGTFTEYATVRRYEEGYEILSNEDLKNVIELASNILRWAQGVIK